MNRNCIIIHGCPAVGEKAMDPKRRTYDKHWIPWTREELSRLGMKVETPLMPEPWHPVYGRFKDAFEQCDIRDDTVLVGTSCGTAFLVHWLGETKRTVAKLILVAPWILASRDNEYSRTFYDFEVDATIPDRVGEIVMFTSDDEKPKGIESLKLLHEAIGGRVINLPNHGHYMEKHMGTVEFPELVSVIMR